MTPEKRERFNQIDEAVTRLNQALLAAGVGPCAVGPRNATPPALTP